MLPDLVNTIKSKAVHADVAGTTFDYVLQDNVPAVVMMTGKIANIQVRDSLELVSRTMCVALQLITGIGPYGVFGECGFV
jgi:hypothetical protein